jgi:DNA-binding NtrC family response regulator
VVSRIFLQELQRAGYRAARAAGFNDLPKDPQAERVDLALILLDIPPSRELEAVRWFKLNRPQIKMLLVWEGHWRGRDSVRELSLLPQLIMPFKTDQLVAVVRQLLADQRDQGMPLLAVPPASGQTMSAVA